MVLAFFYTVLWNRTQSVPLCVLLHASFTPAEQQLVLMTKERAYSTALDAPDWAILVMRWSADAEQDLSDGTVSLGVHGRVTVLEVPENVREDAAGRESSRLLAPGPDPVPRSSCRSVDARPAGCRRSRP